MQLLSQADVILLCIAMYVAVMALVRLMQRRRDQLVADVQRQVEEHRKRAKRAHSDEQSTRSAA
jgi:hypothetical protein